MLGAIFKHNAYMMHNAMCMSLSWDEKWTWGHPDFYISFVSYHDLNGEMHLTAEPTRDIVWMPLRRGVEEPRIGSTQVNMPPAPATRCHRCRC